MLEIRDFQPQDHAAAVTIHNAIQPDDPQTLEERLRLEAERKPELVVRRFTAELEGRVVGLASFEHQEWAFHPRRFQVAANVHPDMQGRGVGGALWAHLERELRPFEPELLRGLVREDRAESLRFAAARGFEEDHRSFGSSLDVMAFDAAPFEAQAARALEGLTVKTYAELEHDPERDRKLYDLTVACDQGSPTGGETTFPDFERFRQIVFGDPRFMPEAFFVALDGDAYIGSSSLESRESQTVVYTGYTGVIPARRGRGVALALKLRALEHARARGFRQVRTDNDSRNAPMLAVNAKLGFRREPAWIALRKVLHAEQAS